MNKPEQQPRSNCPKCGAPLSEKFGFGCPWCEEDDSAAKANYHQIVTLVLLFLPPLVAAIVGRPLTIGTVIVFASPIFGVWAGLHLGFALHYSRGRSKFGGVLYAVIGVFVCPMLTFFGCLAGG